MRYSKSFDVIVVEVVTLGLKPPLLQLAWVATPY